jgi:hypothetical protein
VCAPPLARPVPKGLFTAGFLARLAYEKHALGRPVHQIVQALAADGLDVASRRSRRPTATTGGRPYPRCPRTPASWFHPACTCPACRTAPGTGAREDAEGRWQRAFADIDAHRVLQASDAGKGLLHPAAAKVIATLTSECDGLARHQELPQLPVDNNTAERALRTPVIARTSTAPAPNGPPAWPPASGRSPRPPPGTASSPSAC